jgi:hypothetical protein
VAAEEVIHCRGRAAIGNVHEVDLGFGLQQLDRKMSDASGAG